MLRGPLDGRTSDQELVARVAGGDREAFGALFQRRHGTVFRFALHMTASPSAAEDITQEVFVAVMRDAGRYDPTRADVAAWLCGIARNHVRRWLERERPLQSLGAPGDDDSGIEDVAADDIDPLGDLTRIERIEALRQAVITLPLRYREAVVLCDLQEATYADAAAALGCAIGTIRSRLHRGRALLALKLTAVERMKSEDGVKVQPRAGRGGRCFA